ncbi:ribonuclease 1-like [Zingiber officinale]|uniref:Uncharacterized protein n=1 Tax=Zingiber officinale TaxID=94328 RepID=A0A8J5LFL2_ZINOF|nr:ribonuclease 1-like [Zingiber officinale]KAG6513107.1 hypothetical protein ZIOFF_023415 [Zingiber officinale]
MTLPSIMLLLLLPLLFSAPSTSTARDFDFFYFVLQWPGSFCDTKKSCCYPATGKPTADFSIHGLWPNYADGSYPSNCDRQNAYDASQIADLMEILRSHWPSLACPSGDESTFWKHEWQKHGTCSESVLDQHAYFGTALRLRTQINLLQALQDAGIKPDGGLYSSTDISSAIRNSTGFEPKLGCNADGGGNRQLYEVSVCVDAKGERLIECPISSISNCPPRVEFPPF